MKVNGKYAVECRQTNERIDNAICPFLILDNKVICDAGKEIFQPSNRLIREACTNEQHKLCPLRCPIS